MSEFPRQPADVVDAVADELEALGEPLSDEERALMEAGPEFAAWLEGSEDLAFTAGLVESAHGPGLSDLGRRRAWARVAASGAPHAPARRGAGWVLGLVALAAAVAAVAVLLSPSSGEREGQGEIAAHDGAGSTAGVDPAELESLAGAARDGLAALGLEDGDEATRARRAATRYASRLSEEGNG